MPTFDDPDLESALAKVVANKFTTPVVRHLESCFKANFVGQLRKLGGQATVIESRGTARAVPDVYCSAKGQAFWIEMKFIDVLAGSVSKLPFRAGQRQWLIENMIGGGKSLVGAHFLDAYVFARGDVVAATGGGIPFGHDKFRGYILQQKKLDVEAVLTWAEHAFTLPLLVTSVAKLPMRLSNPLRKERLKEQKEIVYR